MILTVNKINRLGAEKVGRGAHTLRHFPLRNRSPDPAAAGFFVFSKGFAVQAEHRRVGSWPRIRSLSRKFSGPDDCANLVQSL